MHYSHNDILEMAEDLGNGYSRATVTLAKGDTADAPGTTKYDLAGVGTVEYLIHATGVRATTSEGIFRTYISDETRAARKGN